jgi:two-component system, chemotaxis family, chemotaxis protein CheY
MKIFIVDDENEILDLYADAVEMFGHTVIGFAKNGLEAVEMFAAFTERPDIIIMDHRMPVKTGIEAARDILDIDPGARIIFASADERTQSEATKLGVVAFKKKPVTLDRLQKNIQKIELSISNRVCVPAH